MNYHSPSSGFSWDFALHSQHYLSVEIRCVKTVLNTPATEASCCFFISGIFDEAEKYDTNNKRSLDMRDYKEQRSLKFWDFAQFFPNFNQTNQLFLLMVGSTSVSSNFENVDALKQKNWKCKKAHSFTRKLRLEPSSALPTWLC